MGDSSVKLNAHRLFFQIGKDDKWKKEKFSDADLGWIFSKKLIKELNCIDEDADEPLDLTLRLIVHKLAPAISEDEKRLKLNGLHQLKIKALENDGTKPVHYYNIDEY